MPVVLKTIRVSTWPLKAASSSAATLGPGAVDGIDAGRCHDNDQMTLLPTCVLHRGRHQHDVASSWWHTMWGSAATFRSSTTLDNRGTPQSIPRFSPIANENASLMTTPGPTQPTSGAMSANEVKSDLSLSQLIAKVLDQLSLTAWLPSALLVMTLAFVVQVRFELAQIAQAAPGTSDVGTAIVEAWTAWRDLGVADVVLLVAGVVVATTATQAFEFEAIRLLEGYWPPNRLAELMSDLFCAHQTSVRERLKTRLRKLRERALEQATTALRRDADERRRRGKPPIASERDLELIAATVLRLDIDATPEERKSSRKVPWIAHAPPRLTRRIDNVTRKLHEYPAGNRVLPTRLGNVLRSYEEEAFPHNSGRLEGAVQRVFHQLPTSLQSEHDQHRNRLNLYCSLTVVLLAIMAVSLGLLWSLPWQDRLLIAAAGLMAARFAYRAAISSAHAYGGILEVIASQPSIGDKR